MTSPASSICHTPLVTRRFSETAQRVLAESEEWANALTRSAPSSAELLLALLFIGLQEERFVTALDRLGVDRTGLTEELGPALELECDAAEMEDAFRAFIRAASLFAPVDCLILLHFLLESAFLADDAREVMRAHGITADALDQLELPEPDRAEQADRPDTPLTAVTGTATAPDEPPYGRLVRPAAAEQLIGRADIAMPVSERFRAAKRSVLIGPRGVGKSALARAAAALSGRPAVEISAAELAQLDADKASSVLADLDAWLARNDAGLIVTDGDSPCPALARVARRSALIVTAVVHPPLALPAGSSRLRRYDVPEPDKATARLAIMAWLRREQRALDPAAVSQVIDLADRFLRAPGARPGNAIELLRASSSSSTPAIDPVALERTITLATGLPAAVVSAAERARLNGLDDRLASHIVGQRQAIASVSRAIRRRAVALGDGRRPVGVFLFLGPSGVGKTELARAIAAELFGSQAALAKFDMGDYQQRHEVAKLIGAPPGYINSEEGGLLFNKVKQLGRGVILFDEIEKANRTVHDYLLAAFDDGTVSANKGDAKVSLRDFVCVMTSNLGADGRRQLGFGGSADAADRLGSAESRTRELRAFFRPEFIGRLDDIVHFGALTRDEFDQILELRLAKLAERLFRYRLTLELGPALRRDLVERAFASPYGARELVNRIFPREIEDRVTDALLRGAYQAGATLRIDIAAGTAQLEVIPFAAA